MEQQHGALNEVNSFLDDVTQQIQYKPIRNEIRKELAAHIEDRKEEYEHYGIHGPEAWRKALAAMGDAVEVGIQLNEIRKVQKNSLSVLFVIALTVIGMIGTIRTEVSSGFYIRYTDLFYFFFGVIILLITYHFGYQFFAKNCKKILYALLSVLLLYFLFILVSVYFENYSLISFLNTSLAFALRILCIPFVVGFSYFNRKKKHLPILLTTIITAFILITSSVTFLSDYLIAANIIFIVTVYASFLYMIIKKLFGETKRYQIITYLVSLGVVITIFIISLLGNIKSEFEQFIYPERVASDYWDDAYNSILIRELLSKAEFIGPISLSEEESVNYLTGKWYFDDLSDTDIKYRMQFASENGIILEDILPLHYHNNYRVAYWILKYGWFLFFVLISIILTAYGVLFRMIQKINNNMGKIMALSCVIALSTQVIIYVLGNIGYQLGWFCTFPFISEGKCSITINMILAGLACSAYRYDKVTTEDNYNMIKGRRNKLFIGTIQPKN